MKLHDQKRVADVYLFDVEISEDELEVYQKCLEYVLTHVNPQKIVQDFGAYPSEIEGMLVDIIDIRQQSGFGESGDE